MASRIRIGPPTTSRSLGATTATSISTRTKTTADETTITIAAAGTRACWSRLRCAQLTAVAVLDTRPPSRPPSRVPALSPSARPSR